MEAAQRSETREEIAPPVLRLAARCCLGLLAVGLPLFLAALGVLAGLDYCRKFLAARPEYRVDLQTLAVAESPPWVAPGIVRELEDLGRGPEGEFSRPSLLEEGIGDLVGGRLLTSPWVKQVEAVRLVHPRDLEVRLVLRRPAAYVAVRGGAAPYLVDEEGVLLPIHQFPWSENRLKLVFIRNVEPPPAQLAREGWRWTDPALQEGLFLVREVLSQPFLASWNIRSLDVGNLDNIFLVAENGGLSTPIRWGAAHDRASPAELDWRRKLGYLKRMQERGESPERQPVREICLWLDPPYHLKQR